jgi:NADH-quinone oxidoreductase subunit A
VNYRDLGVFGLVEVLMFAVAVVVSLLYLVSKGALEWGPVKRHSNSPMVSAERTASSTIRRVGLEGREIEFEAAAAAAAASAPPAEQPDEDEKEVAA